MLLRGNCGSIFMVRAMKLYLGLVVGVVLGAVTLLGVQRLHFGSQYKDISMVCEGEVFAGLSNGARSISEIQKIGMRVQDDKIELTGNGYQVLVATRVCAIGEIAFARKDQIFVDTSGCRMDAKKPEKRDFASYNYLTKELVFTNQRSFDSYNQGNYVCKEVQGNH
jgi:hypothetical protein